MSMMGGGMGTGGSSGSTDLSGAMADVMQSGYEAGGILQQANLNSKDDLSRTAGYAMQTLKDYLQQSRVDTQTAFNRSQALSEPYREAGYNSLDRVEDALGLTRPEIGNARMAQALDTGARIEGDKASLANEAAKISQYFPTFMGGGGNYQGAPAISQDQMRIMMEEQNQGYNPLEASRYQYAMGYPYPNLAGPQPIPGAAGLQAHGVLPSMNGYPSAPGNTGTMSGGGASGLAAAMGGGGGSGGSGGGTGTVNGIFGSTDGISAGNGPNGTTGMAGPYTAMGTNGPLYGMPLGGAMDAGTQATWNQVTQNGQTPTGPGLGFYPTAIPTGTNLLNQPLSPIQQYALDTTGYNPSTATPAQFMAGFLQQAPVMTATGVDFGGSQLTAPQLALLNQFTSESIPTMTDYQQASQYYTPTMQNLYNAYMSGNFAAPKVI